jgi:antirestriction protein
MTIKQKFSSIDQSKLTADQKSFLDKIKNVTKNFTDAEMNKKVETPLDNFISKAKEKMPEAIKSAPVKKTASAKPSQTRKPKRTAMSLAKEIRKEGESWSDARARASKMMKEDSKDLSKTVETELDKLSKLVRSQKDRKKLSGLSGTNIKRDSARRAKPKGRRISKDGNVYYENRDNRTDRLAPNYPKNAPFLAEGGYLTDPTFGNFQNQVLAEGGDIDAFTLRMVKSNGMQPAEVLKEDTNVKYAGGGIFGSSRPKSALMRDRKNVNHSEDYEVRYSKPRPSRTGYSGNRRFELGGVMTTDLAGHTGGGDAGLNAGMPLDGFSNTSYTGLVGETGAMSSGEMFMAGGKIKKTMYIIHDDNTKDTEPFKNLRTLKQFEEKANELGFTTSIDRKNGWIAISKTPTGNDILIVQTMNPSGKLFMNGGGLPEFSQQSYIITEALGNPAQHLNKGGSLTNERKHVNKDEDYEVRYAKPRPSRTGYKGVRGFATGGALTNERLHVNHNEDYEVRYAKPRPSRKGYKGARKFMAGGSMETPRIYVADLEAYNNGRLVGEWLDLADYNDADELMDAIQDVLKKSGGEEYAIHDVEYVPRSMYSEYMGKRDFEELYEMMDLAKQNDLPLDVVQEVVSQFSESAVEEFVGKYDSATDFAEQLVDDLGGIQNFNDFEYYLDIYETDRRLLSQEMADSYVDDIVGEDGGNRIIEEAGLNVDEYEDASEETKEELIDLARSMVYDEYYDTWYEGLNDPYSFLVEEQGLYDAESFANASFVRVDYDKLAEALEQDYTMISYDGDVYVFNIR